MMSRVSALDLLRSGFTAVVMFAVFLLLIGLFLGIDVIIAQQMGANRDAGILAHNAGSAIGIAFMAIAFVGTSVPLVSLRSRGTLRALGCTPVPRMLFLLAQLPVRIVIATLEILVFEGLLLMRGIIALNDVLGLTATLLLGFAMFMSVGLLLGSRGRNVDLTMQLSLILPVVVVFTAGTVLPTDVFPRWLAVAIDWLPTTWFMRSVGYYAADTTDTALPLWAMLGAMAAVAIGSLVGATALFDWGAEEQ